MRNTTSILVVGSINVDLVAQMERFPNDGETVIGKKYLTVFGGKGANQAVAAARLGAEVHFIGCVGQDNFSEKIIKNLKQEKIDTSLIGKVNQPTGTAFILVNQNAVNKIIVIPGANKEVTPEYIKTAFKRLKSKPKITLLQLEIPINSVIEAAKQAKGIGSLVILNPAPAQKLPNSIFNYLDYIIPNETEAKSLTAENTVEKAAIVLKNSGAKNVIITMGNKGSLIFKDKVKYIPPYKIKAVDPTAAGDAFIAAFAVSISNGKPETETIQSANAAGALTATKIGAQISLPFGTDLVEFIKSQ